MHELSALRDRVHVFRDRTHAGELLADLLQLEGDPDAVVVAIPAGGVPVAVALARRRGAPLDVAVVSKITPPWSTEVGYGAVAFDGTTRLNDALLPSLPLTRAEIEAGVSRTRARVERRVRELRGGDPSPAVRGRAAILVDDGLASGLTMRVAVDAVRAAGATRLVVAVPTSHLAAARALEPEVDGLYIANLRGGSSFAVADAYERWSDVSDDEVKRALGGR